MTLEYDAPIANSLWESLFQDRDALAKFSGSKCLALSVGGLVKKEEGKDNQKNGEEYVRVSIGEFDPYVESRMPRSPQPVPLRGQDSNPFQEHLVEERPHMNRRRLELGQLVDRNYSPVVYLKNGLRGYQTLSHGLTLKDNLQEIALSEFASLGEYSECFYLLVDGKLVQEAKIPTLLSNNGKGPELKSFKF